MLNSARRVLFHCHYHKLLNVLLMLPASARFLEADAVTMFRRPGCIQLLMGYRGYFCSQGEELKCRSLQCYLADFTVLGSVEVSPSLTTLRLFLGVPTEKVGHGRDRLWFASPDASSQLWVADCYARLLLYL